MLAQRADIDNAAATELRKQTSILRVQTIGLINQIRDGIQQELETDPSLPRDLDSQIFAYFDTLEAMRTANTSPSSSDKEGEAAEIAQDPPSEE